MSVARVANIEGQVGDILLQDRHPFLLIDIASVGTFLLPLSYRCLISVMCRVPEMAYLAVLSPIAASISLRALYLLPNRS
jgi:hypothetical protein